MLLGATACTADHEFLGRLTEKTMRMQNLLLCTIAGLATSAYGQDFNGNAVRWGRGGSAWSSGSRGVIVGFALAGFNDDDEITFFAHWDTGC